MRHAAASIVIATMLLAAGAASAWAQSSALQQNNLNANREGSSVTVTNRSVTVETTANAGYIVGDGQPASQTRAIGPVSAISADGAFAVTVKSGPVPGLVIETDKNLLPIVKTDVSNGSLAIYTDRSYSVDGRIAVTVTSPNLSEIKASGSNQITGERLSGENFSMSLSGSNNAVLAGNVSTFTAQLSGSNRLSAQQLSAGSAVVKLSGSGNAAVMARQRIAAEISGAGTISVYGNPKERNTEVNGAGKITFAE
jgi:Putative auto-transporter adhesin, head GIN domain